MCRLLFWRLSLRLKSQLCFGKFQQDVCARLFCTFQVIGNDSHYKNVRVNAANDFRRSETRFGHVISFLSCFINAEAGVFNKYIFKKGQDLGFL